jgi:hypothetical protein
MQLIYKPSGLTINQFIKRIKEQYQNEKICYAGRLDPMARGLVPVLFNEECNNMEDFTTMSKTYQVMIMIGIQTDTDDGLGILTSNLLEAKKSNSLDAINLKEFLADDGLGILTSNLLEAKKSNSLDAINLKEFLADDGLGILTSNLLETKKSNSSDAINLKEFLADDGEGILTSNLLETKKSNSSDAINLKEFLADDGEGILISNLLEAKKSNSSDAINLKEFLADDGERILTSNLLEAKKSNLSDASPIIPISNEDLAIFMDSYKTDFELKNKELYQKFHYYSSKAINKRTHNDFSETYHDVRIHSSSILDAGILPYSMFKENLIQTINKVDKLKDFRQKQIIEQWENLNINSLSYIHLELNVSSGFFVRQFVRDLSTKIGIPLMAHDIHRTKLSIVN